MKIKYGKEKREYFSVKALRLLAPGGGMPAAAKLHSSSVGP